MVAPDPAADPLRYSLSYHSAASQQPNQNMKAGNTNE